MSSCCASSPTKLRISARIRSFSSSLDELLALLEDLAQALLAEQLGAAVHRLGQAVREEEEDVARVERRFGLLEDLLEAHAPVEAQAEALRRQHLGSTGLRLEMQDRVVAGPGVAHGARGDVDDGVGHGHERARVHVGGQDLVRLDQQPGRRVVDAREREHQALELGHVERRRGALARDVGDQHAQARRRERQQVVVVAARPRRPAGTAPRCAGRAGSRRPAAAAGSSGSGARCAAPPRGAPCRPAAAAGPRCRGPSR